MHFIASLTETIPSFTAPIYFRDDIGLKMGKDRSRLGMRKGRKKKNGSTFLDNQKRHRAEVKKSRITKKVKKTDVEEGGEEDAGPRKAFKFQNFSEQVTSLYPCGRIGRSIIVYWHNLKILCFWCKV